MDLLDRLRYRTRPQTFPEVKRIVQLPVAPKLSAEEREAISRSNVQAHAFDEGYRLFDAQADGLAAYDRHGGAFCSIAVGYGKTFLSLLIAQHAIDKGIARVLLLMPSAVSKQLHQKAIPQARRTLRFNLPIYTLRTGLTRRLATAKAKRPGLYVWTYELVSREGAQEILDELAPGLVICDEAQNLRNKAGNVAKVKRFMSWVERAEPEGVCMSGTLTTRTPMDYHHLIRWCLKDSCPLPRPVVQAQIWSSAIKSKAAPTREQTAELQPLLDWAHEQFPEERPFARTTEGLRKAYRLRLQTCPGYVSTGDDKIGTSLLLRNEPTPETEGYEELAALIRQLEEKWLGPDGEELSHAIDKHRIMEELSTGFYHQHVWPDHPLRDRAVEHHEAGQEYHRALREFFNGHRVPREGLDTPFLVGRNMSLYGDRDVPGDLYRLWQKWKDLEHEDLPERLSIPTIVCAWKIEQALSWAQRHGRGIVWVYHQAMLDWTVLVLAEAGLPVLAKRAGDSWLRGDGSHKHVCVASWDAHGVGKELQDHEHQLVLQWPRSAETAEQMLGRVHRNGQAADSLVVTTTQTLEWDRQQFAATLSDTVYIRQTLGSNYKLMYCDWDPVPETYDEEFLRARGWELQR